MATHRGARRIADRFEAARVSPASVAEAAAAHSATPRTSERDLWVAGFKVCCFSLRAPGSLGPVLQARLPPRKRTGPRQATYRPCVFRLRTLPSLCKGRKCSKEKRKAVGGQHTQQPSCSYSRPAQRRRAHHSHGAPLWHLRSPPDARHPASGIRACRL